MTIETTEHTEAEKTEQEVREVAVDPNVEATQPLIGRLEMTESFLKAEVERNRLATRQIWQWGSVAVLVLALYFTAILSSVRSVVFDSDGIAAILSNELDKKLPEQLAVLERALISQAPINARTFIQTILGYLPSIREEGQNSIEEITSTIPMLGEEVNSTIKAYIADNRESIQEFANTHSEQEFAMFFMDDLFAHVVLDIDNKLKQAGEAEGWNGVKSISLKRLVALNTYLEKLANTGRFDLTEKEQLERRTIVTWVKFLDSLE